MNYYNTEKQKAAIKERADHLRKAASFYPVIVDIYRKFDGKCYNKRLEDALRAATENKVFCSSMYKNAVCIEWYDRGDTFVLTWINKRDLKDGKRIVAADFIASAQAKRAEHLKEAADLDRAAEQIEVIKNQLDQLKTAYNAIVGSMPYYAVDVCNIKRIW